MKLCETVTYARLKGASLCGNIPVQSVCASGCDGRAGCEGSTGCVFPWRVVATALVEGTARIGGAEARARCEPELLLCSATVTARSGASGREAGAPRECGFPWV